MTPRDTVGSVARRRRRDAPRGARREDGSDRRTGRPSGGRPHGTLDATDAGSTSRARIGRAAPYVVLAAAFAHNLGYTWLRWGDPVVDCGRELEVARLVAGGALLYGDVRHYYGPFAPLLNGALFRTFGAHAGVLMATGVISTILMTLVVFALARRLSDRLAATAAATAFLYLCAFGHYYFNGIFDWILPYTYSATYGMLAAAASLLLLVRHVQERRTRDLWLAVACLVVAALAKIEIFLCALAAHAVFVAVARPRFAPFVTGAAAALVVAGALFAAVGPRLIDDYLQFALSARFRPMLSLHSGIADWRAALGPIARSAVAFAAALTLVAGGALLSRTSVPAWGRAATAVVSAVGVWLAFRGLPVFDQLRALPLVLTAMLVLALVRWWRGGRDPALLPPLLVAVFALGCMARIPLTAGAHHFGFYLLPVPLVALAVFWFRELPACLPGRPRDLAAATGVALFAALVVTHHQASSALYAKHNTLVRAPRGTMRVLDDLAGFPTGRAHADAVQALAAYPAGTRVLAVPEGAGLAFLAGLASVCGMQSFLPPEMDGGFEDRLLACLEAAPPDLVLVVGVNITEFGSRGFGVDYAQRTADWIVSHYDAVASFGPGAYVRLFRRRG